MFPFWKPEDIDAHGLEEIEVLSSPAGGLWLRAEIGEDVPLENVEVIFAVLGKYSEYYSDAVTLVRFDYFADSAILI